MKRCRRWAVVWRTENGRGGIAAPENREQRTENREQRTENGEQRTERAATARRAERWEGVEYFGETRSTRRTTKIHKDCQNEACLPRPQRTERPYGATKRSLCIQGGISRPVLYVLYVLYVLPQRLRRCRKRKTQISQFGGLEGWRSPRGLGPSCRLRRRSGRNPKTARVGTAEWEPQISQIWSRLRAC